MKPRQAKWQDKHGNAGICRDCPRRAAINRRTGRAARHCKVHLKRRADYMQRWRKRRKNAGGGC